MRALTRWPRSDLADRYTFAGPVSSTNKTTSREARNMVDSEGFEEFDGGSVGALPACPGT
jgi:hypothetical protein